MKPKELSNPFSTGGGGVNFETRIQTSFAIIMLTEGVSPCLPHWPIERIQLQGRHRGYQTDDIIVYVKDPESSKNAKLLCQVKHDITFTKSNAELAETLNAAWADFNNPSVFTQGIDSFALITGPLSGTNLQMRKVLELARNSTDGADFISKIKLGKFTGAKQKEKTGVFQELLRRANSGKTVSEEEFWAFLKAFNILNYDLDIEQGVNIALINSLISQYDVETVRSVWAQLLDQIQMINQNAGVVIPESLPESIVDAFKRRRVETIPKGMARAAIIATAPRPRAAPYSNELALAQLIGAWDDRNQYDRQIVEAIVGESYDSWIIKLRDALFGGASPVHFKDGVWSISDRLEVWEELGDRIFDSHLKAFQQCAVAVLGEVDPKFDLPAEARYAASIHGKVMSHSNALRQGLADSLAILSCNPSALTHCAQNNARSLPGSVVHELLRDADWRNWGSLNRILPLLAEAAPVEFLNAIENALSDAESPFKQLFEDEGAGFVGENYLTGLLWGLEALAWHPDYLSMTSLILGGLHMRDPGGQWANRPLNSLVDIYLPWMPHTTSPIEIRKAAIRALKREQRPTAWQLLVKLLPRKTTTTSGTYEPQWRAFIPQNWKKGVTNKEYVEQIEYYADELLQIAEEDRDRGAELVNCLEFLPTSAFERGVEFLRAKKQQVLLMR
jgi:hypothetical protein